MIPPPPKKREPGRGQLNLADAHEELRQYGRLAKIGISTKLATFSPGSEPPTHVPAWFHRQQPAPNGSQEPRKDFFIEKGCKSLKARKMCSASPPRDVSWVDRHPQAPHFCTHFSVRELEGRTHRADVQGKEFGDKTAKNEVCLHLFSLRTQSSVGPNEQQFQPSALCRCEIIESSGFATSATLSKAF